MRNGKAWLRIAATLAAALGLAGCNGTDGPASPEPGGPPATTNQPASEKSAVSAYVPAKESHPLDTCNLEGVDGVAFGGESIQRPAGEAHSFSGWISTPGLDKPSYWLRFDDQQASRFFQVRINPSIERPDTFPSGSNEAFSLQSGFEIGVPANALPAGEYHVYLAADADNVAYSCDNGRKVLIGD